MRLKDRKLLIFSAINCFLFVIFFLKSGGYYLTESSSVETSIDIVNTTPAPIVVKTTKEIVPAFTGDVIANDLYQKYLGIYQFRNNSLKPSDINSNTNVILLIVTRWTSFDLRGALRQMLKNDNRTKFEYKTIFLFNYDDSASKEDIKRIEDENTVYKDMLMPNVEDNYHTVGLKLLSSFDWITSLNLPNLKWVVKLDDDVIANQTRLDEHLVYHQKSGNDKIHCVVAKNAKPFRKPEAKWYITKMEWPYDHFPDYCMGFSYLVSPENIKKLFNTFKSSMDQSYIWMEDVYITGILAKLSDIGLLSIQHLIHLKKEAPTKNSQFMLAHNEGSTPMGRFLLWQEIFGTK